MNVKGPTLEEATAEFEKVIVGHIDALVLHKKIPREVAEPFLRASRGIKRSV